MNGLAGRLRVAVNGATGSQASQCADARLMQSLITTIIGIGP